MGSGSGNGITVYDCTGLEEFWAGEVVIYIDTEDALTDTVLVEITASSSIFVFSGCDTDSLVTYCLYGGSVCINKVPRGTGFYVFMDWTQDHNNEWEIGFNCYEADSIGEDCHNPIVLEYGFSGAVCPSGYRDDYSFFPSCPGPMHPGADVVYELCLAAGSALHAFLTSECVYFTSLYVFTDCEDPEGSCVAWAANEIPVNLPTSIELWYINSSAHSETVYLVVDNICDTPSSWAFNGNCWLDVEFDPCPPTGACCFNDGSCEKLTDVECMEFGGEFQGYYTDCEPNLCPQPAVCCIGIDCDLLPEDQCMFQGGEWHEEWTSCEPDNPCLPAGIEPDEFIRGTMLFAATPNPFTRSTMLKYHIEHPGMVRLEVIDASGRIVRHLMTEPQSTGIGSVEWDGRSDQGVRVGPGVYFCLMKTDNTVKTQRMIVME